MISNNKQTKQNHKKFYWKLLWDQEWRHRHNYLKKNSTLKWFCWSLKFLNLFFSLECEIEDKFALHTSPSIWWKEFDFDWKIYISVSNLHSKFYNPNTPTVLFVFFIMFYLMLTLLWKNSRFYSKWFSLLKWYEIDIKIFKRLKLL